MQHKKRPDSSQVHSTYMWPIATDVWRGLCVCAQRTGILNKRLDRLTCRLACGVGWALVTKY